MAVAPPLRERGGMATVLVVDDHAAVRAGLVALLAPEPDLEVVAAAADAHTALALAEGEAPEIVLIDFHLPGEDGLSLCMRLEGTLPMTRTVLYSAFADDLLAALAAVAGADALVPKSADPELLLDTLLAVGRGERALKTPSAAALHAIGAGLEPTDLSVLAMLVHGTPAGEVADTLSMPEDWLVARRWAILRRLGPRRARRGISVASGERAAVVRD